MEFAAEPPAEERSATPRSILNDRVADGSGTMAGRVTRGAQTATSTLGTGTVELRPGAKGFPFTPPEAPSRSTGLPAVLPESLCWKGF